MDSSRLEKINALGYIIRRNVFVLTNAVIVFVVALLYFFGDIEASLFLGIVLVLNILLGLTQDVRAWLQLERLQLLTAPKVTRQNKNNTTETILFTQVKKGDALHVSTGDQLPCDGVVTFSSTLEVNEGLITGESSSLPRSDGDMVLAGSIVTAGRGTVLASSIYAESRIARMTEGIKGYAIKQSPIQFAVARVIVISGYVLISAILFIVVRGFLLEESNILIVKQIGALASTLVPQGLAFSMTLLFAYGAAHLFNRNVLLQEVNATEKLGHIKNLCMDKTGTLTENILTVDRLLYPEGVSRNDAERASALYIGDVSDSSQTITAIRAFILQKFEGTIIKAVPFSSWRSFGAVMVKEGNASRVVIAGAPEQLLPQVADLTVRKWLSGVIESESKLGNRIFCIAQNENAVLPNQLSQAVLSPLAVFIFSSNLREGIADAINFFQERNVRIRIISGDHPETVSAIALRAGVKDAEKIVIGSEMSIWSDDDFNTKSKDYTIFARTLPEQKEKIISALKLDGFTAMVGDGANDALAIKNADLGIAMWEGAPATRDVASVVLMNNSFTALPGGVILAESIIRNAAIFASIFFIFSFVSLFMLIIVGMLGYPFPLSPLNVTLINYFTIGIPGILVSFWTIYPAGKSEVILHTKNFLNQVLPYVAWSGVLQAIAISAIFLDSPLETKQSGTNFSVLLATIVIGYIFFLFTPRVFRGKLHAKEFLAMVIVSGVEIIFLYTIFQFPLILRFFEITGNISSLPSIGFFCVVVMFYVIGQYVIARRFRSEV